MRQVTLPGTAVRTSCLGMGCASLGSRIGAAAGLRALEAAHDRGVTWFDVAPPYGAGEAEALLGRFLKGKRDRVSLCTKVGLTPPARNGAIKLAYSLARPVFGRVGKLRSAFRGIGSTRNVHVPLTPALIESSIARSLARLGTDHVDVFALHDPSPDDAVRDDILLALEKVVARGQARYLAVAGSLETAIAAAGSKQYSVVQIADDPLTDPLGQVRSAAHGTLATVSHSILGLGGVREALAKRMEARPELRDQLAASGYEGGPAMMPARLLMARAFAVNPDGVVLASMFSGRHLEQNISMASTPIDPAAPGIVRRVLDQAR